MKKIITLLLLAPILFLLTGCPYDSTFSIDETPQQNIDEDLIGKWSGFLKIPSTNNLYVEKPINLIFEKKSDFEYQFLISGQFGDLKPKQILSNDTLNGTAFFSSISDKKFLNIQIKGRYYIAELQKKKSMGIKFLADNFTAKFVRSNLDLRQAIEIHFKTTANVFYDDRIEFTNLQKE